MHKILRMVRLFAVGGQMDSFVEVVELDPSEWSIPLKYVAGVHRWQRET